MEPSHKDDKIVILQGPYLPHIIPVIAHKHRALDSVHIRELIDEIGVFILKTDLKIEFDKALLSGLAP